MKFKCVLCIVYLIYVIPYDASIYTKFNDMNAIINGIIKHYYQHLALSVCISLPPGGTRLKRWYGYVRWSSPPIRAYLAVLLRFPVARWFCSFDPHFEQNIMNFNSCEIDLSKIKEFTVLQPKFGPNCSS